jgi:NAD dependent epimerase/dehydratase family enzyme
MSWIHLDDVVGLALHALGDDSIQGPMNAVGPRPVTNADFTRTLGRVLHRPTFFPVPVPALRLAFGEMSEVLIASQRVVPTVAEQSGYVFRYADLGSALEAVLRSDRSESARTRSS